MFNCTGNGRAVRRNSGWTAPWVCPLRGSRWGAWSEFPQLTRARLGQHAGTGALRRSPLDARHDRSFYEFNPLMTIVAESLERVNGILMGVANMSP